MSISKRQLLKDAYELLDTEAILTLDTEALEGVAIKKRFDYLAFLNRTKEQRENLRVSDLKINELSNIRKSASEQYLIYGHAEIRQIIYLIDNLIKDQNELKEINQEDIISIKELI